MNLRNILFALICLCGQESHGNPVAWVQVNRQRLMEIMSVAFLSQLLYFWDLDEQRCRGFLKLSLRREGEKPQTRGTFTGRHKKLLKELFTELLYLELAAISASYYIGHTTQFVYRFQVLKLNLVEYLRFTNCYGKANKKRISWHIET